MLNLKPVDPKTLVRNPHRKMRPLKEEGELVPDVPYWHRRLAAREVEIVEPSTPPATEDTKPAEDQTSTATVEVPSDDLEASEPVTPAVSLPSDATAGK